MREPAPALAPVMLLPPPPLLLVVVLLLRLVVVVPVMLPLLPPTRRPEARAVWKLPDRSGRYFGESTTLEADPSPVPIFLPSALSQSWRSPG